MLLSEHMPLVMAGGNEFWRQKEEPQAGQLSYKRISIHGNKRNMGNVSEGTLPSHMGKKGKGGKKK